MIISVFDAVENTVRKEEIACTSNFSFSHNIFKRRLSRTLQKVSLCGSGLKINSFPNDKFWTLPNLMSMQTTTLNFMKMAESFSNGQKTVWEKEKLLVTSNFSFSHSVFKRLLLQTRKNQGLFGKGLKVYVWHMKVEIIVAFGAFLVHSGVSGQCTANSKCFLAKHYVHVKSY